MTGPANQNEFFPTKGFITDRNTQFHQLIVSDEPAGEEAGSAGPGLGWLHMVCGCEAGWEYCQILENNVGGGLW